MKNKLRRRECKTWRFEKKMKEREQRNIIKKLKKRVIVKNDIKLV